MWYLKCTYTLKECKQYSLPSKNPEFTVLINLQSTTYKYCCQGLWHKKAIILKQITKNIFLRMYFFNKCVLSYTPHWIKAFIAILKYLYH